MEEFLYSGTFGYSPLDIFTRRATEIPHLVRRGGGGGGGRGRRDEEGEEEGEGDEEAYDDFLDSETVEEDLADVRFGAMEWPLHNNERIEKGRERRRRRNDLRTEAIRLSHERNHAETDLISLPSSSSISPSSSSSSDMNLNTQATDLEALPYPSDSDEDRQHVWKSIGEGGYEGGSGPSFEEGNDSNEKESLQKAVKRSYWALYTLYFCFFMGGIATTLTWNTILTMYTYFEGKYASSGHASEVLSVNLACYNVPALPIAILQTQFDRAADIKFGFKLSYSVRYIGSCLGFILVLIMLPLYSDSLYIYVINVTFVGVFSGIIYGSLFQLVTLFPVKCTAFLYLGNGFSTLLNVAISGVFGLLSNASFNVVSSWTLNAYFIVTAVCMALCIVSFVILINNRITRGLLTSAQQAHYHSKEQQKVNRESTSSPSSPSSQEGTLSLLRRLKFNAGCIFINKCTILLVLSFFSTIPCDNPQVPHFITYFAVVCDTLGRNLTLFKRRLSFLKSGVEVFFFSLVVRGGFSIFFIAYCLNLIPLNDKLIVTGVSIHFLIGGYLSSLSYTLVSENAGGSTKVGAVMNIANQFGAYVGIGIPLIVKSVYSMNSTSVSNVALLGATTLHSFVR